MRFPGFIPPFRFVLHQHWPWLAGLAMLCFAGELLLVEMPALKTQRGELAHQQRQLQNQLLELESTGKSENGDLLLAHLAPFERLSVVTQDLHTAAQENGLTLSEATYKTASSATQADVKKVEVSVRLKGGYQPLIKMLGQLLADHEGLALDGVAIHRNHANDTANDIEIELAFYYRTQA